MRVKFRQFVSELTEELMPMGTMGSPCKVWALVVLVLSLAHCLTSRFIDTDASSAEFDDDFDLEELMNKKDEITQLQTQVEFQVDSNLRQLEMTLRQQEGAAEEELRQDESDWEKLLNVEADEWVKRFRQTDGGKNDEVKQPEKQRERTEKYRFDDYDYMADQPQPKERVLESSIVAAEPDNKQAARQLMNATLDESELVLQRERSKEMRLDAIRMTILGMRGGNSTEVNTTVPSSRVLQEIMETKKVVPSKMPGNSYTEKLQSFYPSCDVPRQTDSEAWRDNVQMNLLFDVSYNEPAPGSAINIHSAKLRLYRLPHINTTESAATENTGGSSAEDDRQVRISIYWYTRTLKKNRVKRKLLDSQMVQASTAADQQAEWLELNVRTAVRTWKELGRNYGVVVTVEDEDGQLLPANNFIRQMNCSKETATVKPIPSMLVDATKEYMKEHPHANQTNSPPVATPLVDPWKYPVYQFPQLDVCSVEVPVQEANDYQNRMKSDADMNKAATMFNVNAAPARTRPYAPDTDTQHRGVFSTVGVGVPSSGQNRNNLVPIITKSDVVSSPEDGRQKKELLRLADNPRQRGRRHGRKYACNGTA